MTRFVNCSRASSEKRFDKHETCPLFMFVQIQKLLSLIYKELKFEKNWANEAMGLRSRYGLPICDLEVECTGKTEWC